MKEGWEYKKAGEIFDITDFVSNGSFAMLRENVKYLNHPDYAILIRLADYSNDFDEDKFVYVNKQSYEFLAKSKLFGGEIIMSNVGSVGKSFLCPKLEKPMTIGPNAILIRSDYNKFFLYYFQTKEFYKELLSITSNATLKKFNKTNFKTLFIPVPSLAEQQQIVSFLDSEFEKIDALKANAEEQLQAAKDLFQAALKELLTPKEGWVEKKLKEVGKTQTGSTPSKSNANYYGNYIPFIRPAELNFNNNGEIKYDSEVKLSESGANCSRVIDENSVLMCCIGSIGKIGFTTLKVTCNQQINTITPCSDYNARFIYYALLSPDFQEEAIKIANSARATLAIISKGKWENIFIPIPPRKEQQRIADRLDALSANVKALQTNYTETITLCNDLKQALLKKVFG